MANILLMAIFKMANSCQKLKFKVLQTCNHLSAGGVKFVSNNEVKHHTLRGKKQVNVIVLHHFGD
jgi:hypothetical protein